MVHGARGPEESAARLTTVEIYILVFLDRIRCRLIEADGLRRPSCDYVTLGEFACLRSPSYLKMLVLQRIKVLRSKI